MSTTRAAFGIHELARAIRVEPAETCPSSPRDLAESIVDALVSRETVTGEGPYFWLDGDAEDILDDHQTRVSRRWLSARSPDQPLARVRSSLISIPSRYRRVLVSSDSPHPRDGYRSL